MMNRHPQSGFSLVQIMVASGLLGMIALGVMHISSNLNSLMTNASSTQDQISFFNEIEMILGNEADCRVSLSGEKGQGRQTFHKEEVDGDPQEEGLVVELSNATQDGHKIKRKRFSSIDPELAKYGDIIIKEMKLQMNNGTGKNYAPRDFHVDQGELLVEIGRRTGVKEYRKIEKRFPVQFTLSTNQQGLTEIISCSNKSDAMAAKKACENAGRFYKPGHNPPCSLSLKKINTLSAIGETDGSMGVLRCPEGFGITGLSGSENFGKLHQLRIHCEAIQTETLKPDHSNPYGSAAYGRMGSKAASSVCDEGKWASGFKASVSNGLSGVALHCSDYDGNQKNFARSLGEGSGLSQTKNCDEQTVLRELSIYYSDKIEGLRGVCW